MADNRKRRSKSDRSTNTSTPEKKKRGRPVLPPGKKIAYTRKSVSLPNEKWKNIEDLSKATNSLARRGSGYDKPSWRTLLHLLADDAPRMIKQLQQLQRLEGASFGTFHFSIDIASGLESSGDEALDV